MAVRSMKKILTKWLGGISVFRVCMSEYQLLEEQQRRKAVAFVRGLCGFLVATVWSLCDIGCWTKRHLLWFIAIKKYSQTLMQEGRQLTFWVAFVWPIPALSFSNLDASLWDLPLISYFPFQIIIIFSEKLMYHALRGRPSPDPAS